jgi:transposase-like protein
MGRTRRSFTTEFKADAVCLVWQQGYTVGQACQALGVGETVEAKVVLFHTFLHDGRQRRF